MTHTTKTVQLIEVEVPEKNTQLLLLPFVCGTKEPLYLVIAKKADKTLPFLNCYTYKEISDRYGSDVAALFNELAEPIPNADISNTTQGGQTMANSADKSELQDKIVDLKAKLFDVIEGQAILFERNKALEAQKSKLAELLGAARQQLDKIAKLERLAWDPKETEAGWDPKETEAGTAQDEAPSTPKKGLLAQ